MIKTADHGILRVFCAEAPEIWIFDIVPCNTKIDPLFMQVIEPDTLCAIGGFCWIDVDGGFVRSRDSEARIMIAGIRKGFKGTRFTRHTEKQYQQNLQFWSQQFDKAAA